MAIRKVQERVCDRRGFTADDRGERAEAEDHRKRGLVAVGEHQWTRWVQTKGIGLTPPSGGADRGFLPSSGSSP